MVTCPVCNDPTTRCELKRHIALGDMIDAYHHVKNTISLLVNPMETEVDTVTEPKLSSKVESAGCTTTTTTTTTSSITDSCRYSMPMPFPLNQAEGEEEYSRSPIISIAIPLSPNTMQEPSQNVPVDLPHKPTNSIPSIISGGFLDDLSDNDDSDGDEDGEDGVDAVQNQNRISVHHTAASMPIASGNSNNNNSNSNNRCEIETSIDVMPQVMQVLESQTSLSPVHHNTNSNTNYNTNTNYNSMPLSGSLLSPSDRNHNTNTSGSGSVNTSVEYNTWGNQVSSMLYTPLYITVL